MAPTTLNARAHADSHRPASPWIGTMVSVLSPWRQRARQRRLLLTLDDSMLKDIAVTRVDAEFEARKPFWTP